MTKPFRQGVKESFLRLSQIWGAGVEKVRVSVELEGSQKGSTAFCLSNLDS